MLTLAALVVHIPAQDQDPEEPIPNIPAVLNGLRANAVEGDVVYVRENAKFPIEADLELKQADTLRTGANSRVELLLQPGNLLRAGANTECPGDARQRRRNADDSPGQRGAAAWAGDAGPARRRRGNPALVAG